MPTGFMNPPQVPQGITPTGIYFGYQQVYTGATAPDAPVVTPTSVVTTIVNNEEIPKTIAIKSLLDCMIQARDAKMFFDLVNQNPWVLIVWISLW